MITERDAYHRVTQYEQMARERGQYEKHLGAASVKIILGEDGLEYMWGGFNVEKQTVLHAVRTFGEPVR